MLEQLFPAAPVCDPDAIAPGVEAHFEAAVRNHAPFMLAASWKLERETLRRDILRAATNWRDLLQAEGAEILATEIRLHGEAHGIRMRGSADCILRLGDGQVLIAQGAPPCVAYHARRDSDVLNLTGRGPWPGMRPLPRGWPAPPALARP